MNIDYYPGGVLLPGRSASSESYRYKFNGMESDDEVSGVVLNVVGGIITGIGVGIAAIGDYEVDAEKITVEINPQKIHQTEPSTE